MSKKLTFLILFLTIVTISPYALSQSNRYKNKVRQDRVVEKFKEEIVKIPIYREKLEGNYKILGPVFGQDTLTNKKDSIINQMRITAYKAKADAIMEFKCKKFKALYQTCEGFAVRFEK